MSTKKTKLLFTECQTEASGVMALPNSAAAARDCGSAYYFTGTPCKRGHISQRYTSSQGCVECSAIRHKERCLDKKYVDLRNAKAREKYASDEEYRNSIKRRDRKTKRHRDVVNRRAAKKKKNDPNYRAKQNSYQREYGKRPDVKEKRRSRDAKRYQEKKEAGIQPSDARKEYSRNYMRKRLLSDPKFRVNLAFSASVRRCLLNGKAGAKWEVLVGYTLVDLMQHLEQRFSDGMSWENYGRWHIDHIIPLAAHNFETPHDIDFKRAWALSNLQPLWAVDNIKKRDKLDIPFQPSLALAISEHAT